MTPSTVLEDSEKWDNRELGADINYVGVASDEDMIDLYNAFGDNLSEKQKDELLHLRMNLPNYSGI